MYLEIFLGGFFNGFKKRTEGESDDMYFGISVSRISCLGQMNGMAPSCLLAVGSREELG